MNSSALVPSAILAASERANALTESQRRNSRNIEASEAPALATAILDERLGPFGTSVASLEPSRDARDADMNFSWAAGIGNPLEPGQSEHKVAAHISRELGRSLVWRFVRFVDTMKQSCIINSTKPNKLNIEEFIFLYLCNVG